MDFGEQGEAAAADPQRCGQLVMHTFAWLDGKGCILEVLSSQDLEIWSTGGIWTALWCSPENPCGGRALEGDLLGLSLVFCRSPLDRDARGTLGAKGQVGKVYLHRSLTSIYTLTLTQL